MIRCVEQIRTSCANVTGDSQWREWHQFYIQLVEPHDYLQRDAARGTGGRILSDLLDTDELYRVVHARFEDEHFPSWARAHPARYLIHNGKSRFTTPTDDASLRCSPSYLVGFPVRSSSRSLILTAVTVLAR
jgi:hypothetical protein